MAVTMTLGARPMPALVRVLVVVDAVSIGFWIAVLDGKPLAGVIVGLVAALLLRRLWQAHVTIVMSLPVSRVPTRTFANGRHHDRA